MTPLESGNGPARQQAAEDALLLLRQALEILDREKFPAELRARVSETIDAIEKLAD